ncbi:hypothetical protein Vafri_14249 [Volvox africanus]|uniref:UBX domain-containing protein n=1 Tax=Volvox africanus TaxID=51714 RepID=A0A8J4F3D9_9CHLO|nr:hypothetical protein Vafri_14249 [Volvox africanus]
MDEPDNLPELVSEFATITGASPLVADHYLSACNYDLNRAVEFYFEHPPAPNQTGPRPATGAPDDDVAALRTYGEVMDLAERTYGPGDSGAAGRDVGDEDEELQRALAASMAEAEPGPRRNTPESGAPARPTQGDDEDVQMIDDDEDMPSADDLLEAMARQRDASMAADREARQRIEEAMDRMLGQITGRQAGGVGMPPGYPPVTAEPLAGVASIFPGIGNLLQSPGFPLFPGGLVGRGGHGRDDGGGGGSSAQEGAPRTRDGGVGSAGIIGQGHRRRIGVHQGGSGGAGPAGVTTVSGRGNTAWDDDELELPEGMSRHELEEARMMEAALLGVPYEGRGLRDFSSGRAAGGSEEMAPELREHRELRWDQDRAYEESLAADRAKEQAAARAKAEAEARERAQREAEVAAERAAAEEAARLASLVAAKAARLPPEPPASSADAITVMVRLPDGSRHSRRFTRTDRLSSLFDFVDVELDSAAKAPVSTATGDGGAGTAAAQPSLKPGSYNLVAQFPRRVFCENENGEKTFEEAGLAGGGGAAFFIEQKNG